MKKSIKESKIDTTDNHFASLVREYLPEITGTIIGLLIIAHLEIHKFGQIGAW